MHFEDKKMAQTHSDQFYLPKNYNNTKNLSNVNQGLNMIKQLTRLQLDSDEAYINIIKRHRFNPQLPSLSDNRLYDFKGSKIKTNESA